MGGGSSMWVGGTENGPDPRYLERLRRNQDPRTMHPDLAEQFGIPTYRQTGDLGDFYARRGHVIADAWREYDKLGEKRMKEAGPIANFIGTVCAASILLPVIYTDRTVGYTCRLFRKLVGK